MKKINGKKAAEYLVNKYGKLKHEPEALAYAANEICEECDHDNALDLLKLLTENTAIPGLHTHSYSFNTATGRHIINLMKEKYYEYEN